MRYIHRNPITAGLTENLNYTLSTICNEFGLKKDSSAGSIVDRVKKQILKDKQFRNKVAGIKKIINKS